MTLTLLDENGDTRATLPVTVNAHSAMQINDVFSAFGVAPFAGASIRASSSLPISAYASVIRNDSGDADFISGAAPDRAVTDVITPACASPARLSLSIYPAPGFLVVMKPGTPVDTTVAELQKKYGFTVTHVLRPPPNTIMVISNASAEAIAGLRCEAVVDFIEQDSYGTILTTL